MGMETDSDELSGFWDRLLSRQPDLIENAFQLVSEPEQKALVSHLIRMRDEEGWLPEQRLSATVAIQVIEKLESDRHFKESD
jgi:hypothetical protein